MLWTSVAPTDGAAENPSARIIIMIWRTTIVWLSQIRTARRRAASATPPATAAQRPTAIQASTTAEACPTPSDRIAGAADAAAPVASRQSG